MNKRVAKSIHATTNLCYWMENPEWQSGNAAFDFLCRGLRALPFSFHEAQKKAFFDTNRLLAVNGESVVVANGTDKVDKFMFRYPGRMATEEFRSRVDEEVGVVTQTLAKIALATEVDIKPAYIFRPPRTHVDAVVQTQARLDLGDHEVLDLAKVLEEGPSPRLDRTMSDLESMLEGAEDLSTQYGYHVDITKNSGNLRRSVIDGVVTLIDVMPFYSDGNRLIDDHPPGLMEHTLESIRVYQEAVGQYGA